MITLKTFILFIAIFLIIPIADANKRIRKGGGFGSSRRSSSDNDGFSFFGKSNRKDTSFSRNSDDDSYRSYSRGALSRRTNAYANKKMDQFGQNFGRSVGSLIASVFGSKEQKIVTGKRVRSAANSVATINQQNFDWLSIILVVIFASVSLWGIYLFLTKKPFAPDEVQLITKKAIEKRKENYKNFEILKFIKTHGVHPDRATGRIYQVNL